MDDSELSTLEKLIDRARHRLRISYAAFTPDVDHLFTHVDGAIGDDSVSTLEKAMYLLLNQYLGAQQDYFVVPRERVRVPDVYALEPSQHHDYEIDFAVYAGSAQRLVKVAIECDGMRAHRERHPERDTHKDVNLQAAGWTVLPFGTREIHDELMTVAFTDAYTNRFVQIISNVVAAHSDAVTERSYRHFQERLTGYTFGLYNCPACDHQQRDRLELATTCRQCGEKIPAQRPS